MIKETSISILSFKCTNNSENKVDYSKESAKTHQSLQKIDIGIIYLQ